MPGFSLLMGLCAWAFCRSGPGSAGLRLLGWCPRKRFLSRIRISHSFSLEPIPGQTDQTCRSSQIFGTCWSSQVCPGFLGFCRLVRTQPIPGQTDQACRSSQIFGTCWSSQLCPGFPGLCRGCCQECRRMRRSRTRSCSLRTSAQDS